MAIELAVQSGAFDMQENSYLFISILNEIFTSVNIPDLVIEPTGKEEQRIHLRDAEGSIQLLNFKTPGEFEQEQYVNISVISRCCSSIVLMAAAAIVISKHENTDIIDDAELFGRMYHHPDQLLLSLSLTSSVHDLETASSIICSKFDLTRET